MTFERLARGALGGAAGTVPMTVALVAMHRRLPPGQRHPLPPREISYNVMRATGVAQRLPEGGRRLGTWVGHFGYGALAGAALGALAPRGGVGAGVAGGLALWAVSYLGWLPAAGLAAPLDERPRERVALMIAAHLVWGTGTALAVRALRRVQGADA